MRRSFTRPKAFAALAAFGLIAAGCGGSSSSGSAGAAGTDGLGAQAAPASSIAFFDVNIDRGSAGWKQLLALGARFPSWPKLITQLNTSLNSVGSNGSSFNRDIEPWLGGEASVAVTGVTVGGTSGGGSAQFVVYVQSTDDGKLETALTSGGEAVKGTAYSGYDTFTSKDGKTFAAVHDGALLVSNSETTLHQAIDVRGGTGDQLANATSYKDALAALPKDNSAIGYVDGAQLATLGQLATSQASSRGVQAGGVSPQALNSFSSQLKGVRALAFAATPEDLGLRFRFAELLAKDAPATLTDVKEFTPTLESSVSGDSYVYLGFQDLGPMLKQALTSLGTSQAQLTQTFSALQTQTGISFDDDLVPLLSGEHAITVGPGPARQRGAAAEAGGSNEGRGHVAQGDRRARQAGCRAVHRRQRRADDAGLRSAGRLAPLGRSAGHLERSEGRRRRELVARRRLELDGLPEGDRRPRQRHRPALRQRRTAARPRDDLHELLVGIRQGGARQRVPRRPRRGLGFEERRHADRRPVRRDHEVVPSRLRTLVAPGMIPVRRA